MCFSEWRRVRARKSAQLFGDCTWHPGHRTEEVTAAWKYILLMSGMYFRKASLLGGGEKAGCTSAYVHTPTQVSSDPPERQGKVKELKNKNSPAFGRTESLAPTSANRFRKILKRVYSWIWWQRSKVIQLAKVLGIIYRTRRPTEKVPREVCGLPKKASTAGSEKASFNFC